MMYVVSIRPSGRVVNCRNSTASYVLKLASDRDSEYDSVSGSTWRSPTENTCAMDVEASVSAKPPVLGDVKEHPHHLASSCASRECMGGILVTSRPQVDSDMRVVKVDIALPPLTATGTGWEEGARDRTDQRT